MKTENNSSKIRQDCAYFMRRSIIIRLFSDLFAIFAPTLTAILVGNMADELLILDVSGIKHSLPLFIISVVFVVCVVPLFQFAENMFLTKDGFRYDAFLVGKFINMPLINLQNIESGAVIERLEINSAAYCFNQVYKWSRPFVIAIFAAVLIFIMITKSYNPLFMTVLILFAMPPVIKTSLISKKRAQVIRESSEYTEHKKTQEQCLFNSKGFVRGYNLSDFMVKRFSELFEQYICNCGKLKYTLEAKDALLDFLFDYGIKALIIVIGAIMISMHKLTAGSLLAGFLMLPYITKCFFYASELIDSRNSEKENEKRISIFYSDSEKTGVAQKEKIDQIHFKNISFRYPRSENAAIKNINIDISNGKNILINGKNGSGKTTLLMIICGLYNPETGTVTDGNGASVTKATLREQIAFQEQDGTIFGGTVLENLFVHEKKIPQCTKLLQDLGFEKPLDYEIKQNGQNLSPGEKKKILLTRALAKDAVFLVLDEPFNHLDTMAKKNLLNLLEIRHGGLIIISHHNDTNLRARLNADEYRLK